MNIRKGLWHSFLIAGLLTAAGCGQKGQMSAYPEFIDLFPREMVRFPPVIVVGRILSCVPVGSPRPSNWDGETPYQEYRTTVAVENVLNGSVKTATADVYFLKNIRIGGPARLGTQQYAGYWRIGDREMFFLQFDAGRLRTVCDTWAHCVIPVLTGRHSAFRPLANVGASIADIFFTRGDGASDAEIIEGLEHTTSFGFQFAPHFSAQKMEELVQRETPPVRKAVCHYVQMELQAGRNNVSLSAAVLAADPAFINAARICSADDVSR